MSLFFHIHSISLPQHFYIRQKNIHLPQHQHTNQHLTSSLSKITRILTHVTPSYGSNTASKQTRTYGQIRREDGADQGHESPQARYCPNTLAYASVILYPSHIPAVCVHLSTNSEHPRFFRLHVY